MIPHKIFVESIYMKEVFTENSINGREKSNSL